MASKSYDVMLMPTMMLISVIVTRCHDGAAQQLIDAALVAWLALGRGLEIIHLR